MRAGALAFFLFSSFGFSQNFNVLGDDAKSTIQFEKIYIYRGLRRSPGMDVPFLVLAKQVLASSPSPLSRRLFFIGQMNAALKCELKQLPTMLSIVDEQARAKTIVGGIDYDGVKHLIPGLFFEDFQLTLQADELQLASSHGNATLEIPNWGEQAIRIINAQKLTDEIIVSAVPDTTTILRAAGKYTDSNRKLNTVVILEHPSASVNSSEKLVSIGKNVSISKTRQLSQATILRTSPMNVYSYADPQDGFPEDTSTITIADNAPAFVLSTRNDRLANPTSWRRMDLRFLKFTPAEAKAIIVPKAHFRDCSVILSEAASPL